MQEMQIKELKKLTLFHYYQKILIKIYKIKLKFINLNILIKYGILIGDIKFLKIYYYLVVLKMLLIDKAVKNICNIKVQKNLDNTSTKMDKINENDFIKQNDKIKKIIDKGNKKIWKEALGSVLGGGASAGAYAFGIIAGGPAIALGGFLALVGWKTGSYLNNDKEKTD